MNVVDKQLVIEECRAQRENATVNFRSAHLTEPPRDAAPHVFALTTESVRRGDDS